MSGASPGLIYGIAALILGSGGFGVLITKVMPQRLSKDERLEKVERRLAALEEKLVLAEAKSRTLEDYAEDLRVHISEERGKPPPDWPESLR